MKNLFVFIAVSFGGFVLALLAAVVFSLYGYSSAKVALFIVAAVFFAAFVALVVTGFILSAKIKKRDGDKK